ncbi:MAG: class I SAM-dependent methyltransferase [Elusimicrobia bacterium]|nr:class I SAM-dependent methyltransferase [Elusimicrobiota bacterium]
MLKRLLARHHGWKTRRKMERLFSRRPDPYGYFSHPHELGKQQLLLDMISDRRYPFALEMGCAEGAFTRRLAGLCDFIVAVDISKTAVERAKITCKDIPSIRFLHADITEVELPHALDLIVACEVLYYWDKRSLSGRFAAFLRRTAESLKPGGRLALLHSFANEEEYSFRKSYRERLEGFGLTLEQETIRGGDPKKSRYLVSVLMKPPD